LANIEREVPEISGDFPVVAGLVQLTTACGLFIETLHFRKLRRETVKQWIIFGGPFDALRMKTAIEAWKRSLSRLPIEVSAKSAATSFIPNTAAVREEGDGTADRMSYQKARQIQYLQTQVWSLVVSQMCDAY
jgi:hypothetical protein